MAVGLSDATILVVDTKFRALILAHLPSGNDRVLLLGKMPARTISSASFHIPTTRWIWYYVVGLWSFVRHG